MQGSLSRCKYMALGAVLGSVIALSCVEVWTRTAQVSALFPGTALDLRRTATGLGAQSAPRSKPDSDNVSQQLAGVAKDSQEDLAEGWKRMLMYVGTGQPALGQPRMLHAQVGQDWLVASLLGCRRGGFFVDLAANDAERISNTLMLERDFGWDGVCVEANPAYHWKLARRRCQMVAAVVASPTNLEVNYSFAGVRGGIVSDALNRTEVSVKGQKLHPLRTVALEEVLRAVRAPALIDYFSLDVEGAETMVMESFPWDRRKFLVFTVERPPAGLKVLLSRAGYSFLRLNTDNFFDETWIHNSIPRADELKDMFGSMASKNWQSCMDGLGYPRPHYGNL